jgi:hypothetical protein
MTDNIIYDEFLRGGKSEQIKKWVRYSVGAVTMIDLGGNNIQYLFFVLLRCIQQHGPFFLISLDKN